MFSIEPKHKTCVNARTGRTPLSPSWPMTNLTTRYKSKVINARAEEGRKKKKANASFEVNRKTIVMPEKGRNTILLWK